MQKSRVELKSYFKKGAIPTEEQFTDLIDSTLNPGEDGMAVDAETGELAVNGDLRVDGMLQGPANEYIKAQFTMSGGGEVTWVNPRLKWTKRFIAIPVGKPNPASQGHIEINQPQANIPKEHVYDGRERSANADGVELKGWEALYAVHTVGGNKLALHLRIVRHSADFTAPSNWLLVAVVNGDDKTVKLGTGETLPQPRLDVANVFKAYVRAADLYLGFSTRRGEPGRALVDLKDRLVVNFASDWKEGTRVDGKLHVTGTTTLKQEDWQTANFESVRRGGGGWQNYARGYLGAGYFKDSMGIVHLKGLVKSGAIGKTIFKLPAGYRPRNRSLHVACTHPNTAGRIDVTNEGLVIPVAGSTHWISLDGITFRAER